MKNNEPCGFFFPYENNESCKISFPMSRILWFFFVAHVTLTLKIISYLFLFKCSRILQYIEMRLISFSLGPSGYSVEIRLFGRTFYLDLILASTHCFPMPCHDIHGHFHRVCLNCGSNLCTNSLIVHSLDFPTTLSKMF